MVIEFEWDPDKARKNIGKHRVAFEEAATVFQDTLSITADDPDHSENEDRVITVGFSSRGRPLIVSHTDRGKRIRIIVHENSLVWSVRPMKKKPKEEDADELRPEYDLRQLLRDGIQGKYAQRYEEGTNLVLLAPDVAKAFPTQTAVNEALRLVIELGKLSKANKQTGAKA